MQETPDVCVRGFGIDLIPYERELDLSRLTYSRHVDPWPSMARALVVVAGPRQLGAVRDFLDARWRDVIDCGAHVIVGVPHGDVPLYTEWREASATLKHSETRQIEEPSLHISISDPRTIANRVLLCAPQGGPSASLSCDATGLTQSDIVLLKRAFRRCDLRQILPLHPGATARVYRVDVRDAPGMLLPFLVKIGPREKIIQEFDNFVDNVRDFVPFYCRPNLDTGRCLVGATDGVLVAHFIEDSEPVLDTIIRGGSRSVFHSVFDELLRGWWSDTQAKISNGPVTHGLEKWFDPSDPDRKRTLQSRHRRAGSSSRCDPGTLARRLISCPASEHFRSWIHGDLHAQNVHVRDNQSFLIDFGSVIEGPILADSAMLEASIVLEVGVRAAKDRELTAWREALRKELYVHDWDGRRHVPDVPMSPKPKIRGMCTAVRVIRMHAFHAELSAGDYRTVLAAAFVRVACFAGPRDADRAKILAELYALATRLVMG